MKRAHRRKSGKGGIELIEEATHLLRTAPMATLATYYVGAIPFVLGFLYYWADMSRSPFANQHLAEGALALAALFIWMKFCQARFARSVRAQLTAEPLPRWSLRQNCRVFLSQAIVQPFGLFLIPLSLIPAIPFAWVYSFYQNLTALADPDAGTSKLVKRSWKQALLWPWQNHIVLAIASVFGFCVFLNWIAICMFLPGLIKMFFGIESAFTRSPESMLNTTFFTAIFALTYLCVDPILKVIYVLRCFYGESLQSGEDLKAELKQFASSTRQLAAAVVIAISLACGFQAHAADAGSPTQQVSPAVSPVELDRAIRETISERKYTWRMPREQVAKADAEQGPIGRFFAKAGEMIRDTVKAVAEWLRDVLRKLFRSERSGSGGGSGTGWITTQQIFLFSLAAVVLSVLAVFLIRVWRRRRKVSPIVAQVIQPAPDIADENVRADQLPEDGWTRLARELLERGEFRLAMRAFYLASLAHLAERNLISIARFKSNRDYERELLRRAHAFPNMVPVFGENLSVFERIWYGMHEVNRDLVNQFAANVEKIRNPGAGAAPTTAPGR